LHGIVVGAAVVVVGASVADGAVADGAVVVVGAAAADVVVDDDSGSVIDVTSLLEADSAPESLTGVGAVTDVESGAVGAVAPTGSSVTSSTPPHEASTASTSAEPSCRLMERCTS
jgi:hypothetical protein